MTLDREQEARLRAAGLGPLAQSDGAHERAFKQEIARLTAERDAAIHTSADTLAAALSRLVDAASAMHPPTVGAPPCIKRRELHEALEAARLALAGAKAGKVACWGCGAATAPTHPYMHDGHYVKVRGFLCPRCKERLP